MKMPTAIKQVKVQNQYGEMRDLIITAQSTDNDFNGNPMALFQIWTTPTEDYNGMLWYPKIKGYRDRKDNAYKGYIHGGIDTSLDIFVKHLQEALLNNR